MAQFNFTVDTAPMADSILEVAGHVDNTTTAVIAMNEALVLAEAESAAKICKHVNYGFYSLIRSQVSQKIATHKSKADAKLVELHQQTIALNSIKETMERDYQTLSSRYSKLFEGLNQALRIRIFELDKPVLNFIRKEILPLLQRPALLSGIPSTSQLESVVSSQHIAVSNTRFNTRNNLTFMQGFIRQSEEQQHLISSVLVKHPMDTPIPYAVPLIMCAYQDSPSSENLWQVQFPSLHPDVDQTLLRQVMPAVEECGWTDSNPQHQHRIKQDYQAKVSQANLPERVKSRMQEMMASASWQQTNL